MTLCVEPGRLEGSLVVPPSKSAMIRAVACALMADGESVIENPSRSADARAALGIAAALGASVDQAGDREPVVIRGHALRTAPAGRITLNCGESALCLRMFSAIAALLPVPVELRAEGSLAKRDVSMVEDGLRDAGVECRTAAGRPPVTVRGPMKATSLTADGSASSQAASGLLLALPLAGGSELAVERPASGGYLDLSAHIMAAFGVQVHRFDDAGPRAVFTLSGARMYRPACYAVEGDWSSAAAMAAAVAASGGRVEFLGLLPGSSQPDKAVQDALRLADAGVSWTADGRLVVDGSRALHGFEFDVGACPDLAPPLVALASCCQGTSVLKGASRLSGKESDRASALALEFGKLGVDVRQDGDLLCVRGLGPRGHPLAATVWSHGDHRVAMAVSALATRAKGPVYLRGAECVDKSWPGFFRGLASLRTS
ncbi:MAG: 3-phosphoshikimate 1-carboxyvinyltransferase [Spirochaetia bacterium]|nr:3-phosphoshikimate 1-carboxyvinyltransferase [Spirochaetia bacterium]